MKHDIRPRSNAPLLGQRKKRRTLLTWFIFFIALVSMGTTAWYASRSPWFEITTIGVEDDGDSLGVADTTIIALTEHIHASVFTLLNESRNHWWWRTSTLFAPYHTLETELKKQLPLLADVHVRPSGLTSIDVRLISRTQAFTVCEGEFAYYDPATSPCYAVDASGTAFQRLVSAAPATIPEEARFFIPFETATTTATTTFAHIDASLLHRLRDFISLIAVKGITAQAIELAQGHADIFVPLSHALDDTSMITINTASTAESLEEQALTLTTFLSSPTIQKRLATTTFEYIDMRYGENVFYKMKTGFASSTTEN